MGWVGGAVRCAWVRPPRCSARTPWRAATAPQTRATFQQGSAAIASTLKLAIQRQEELTVAAATFFAANPKASPAEFAAWVTWARTQRRYPELDAIGLLPAPPRPRRSTRTRPSAPRPRYLHRNLARSVNASSTPISASSDTPPTPIDASSEPPRHPPSNHQRSAPISARLSLPSPPVHVPPALALSRDTGLSIYTPISAGRQERAGRRDARLPGQRDAAQRVRPQGGIGGMAARGARARGRAATGAGGPPRLCRAAAATVAPPRTEPAPRISCSPAAAPQTGAQSTTINLHDGWTVTSFGPPPVPSVLTDGDALALLSPGSC